VTVTFDEALDCRTVAADAVVLSQAGVAIAGTTLCSGNMLTFNATTGLPTNVAIAAVVSAAVTDVAGNHLQADYQWSFDVDSWTVQAGTSGADAAAASAVDAAGNVYVAGSTDSAIDGNASLGGTDALIVKFDRFGVKQWSRTFGTAADDSALAVAVDGAGNIYVGGYTGNTYGYDLDGFVAKYDTAGNRLWVKSVHSASSVFGLPAQEMVRGLATTGDGRIVAVGYTEGGLFGVNAAPSGQAGTDLFVAEFDGDGNLLWGRQLGTATTDNAASVASDADGSVYLAGYTYGALDGNVSAGGADAIVVKWSPDGIVQWQRHLGGADDDAAEGVAFDGAGHLYVTGRTSSVMDGTSSAGGRDAFVAQIDAASGVVSWVRQLGSPGDDIANGVVVDAAGNVVVAGAAGGALPGGASAGGSDAFVAKFDPLGNSLWLRQAGTGGDDTGAGVSIDAAGELFVVGTTPSAFPGLTSAGGTDLFVVKFDSDGTPR